MNGTGLDRRARTVSLDRSTERTVLMTEVTIDLLKTQLRQLRLPTIGREFEKLARDAAATNQTFTQFLLRLTEIELGAHRPTRWRRESRMRSSRPSRISTPMTSVPCPVYPSRKSWS